MVARLPTQLGGKKEAMLLLLLLMARDPLVKVSNHPAQEKQGAGIFCSRVAGYSRNLQWIFGNFN